MLGRLDYVDSPSARSVRAGDRLRVIAPSGPFDVERFHAGVAFLRERYEVVFDDDIVTRTGYLAGDDARRLRELEAALDDPDATGIVCARGGFGATRLLAHLSPDRVRAAPKLLVGFSDVTALHALWARAGVPSLHAPMVAWLGGAEDAAREDLQRALEGARRGFSSLRVLARGTAEGPIVGGNLAVLAALVGTPHAPPIDGAVLLLEEVGEAPYRVDRMLTTLHHAGWLDRVAGVALGDFVRCDPGAHGVRVEEVLEERLGALGVPVVAGLPVGHGDRNEPIHLGARVHIAAPPSP